MGCRASLRGGCAGKEGAGMKEELIKAIVALLEKAGERELDLIYRFVANIIKGKIRPYR